MDLSGSEKQDIYNAYLTNKMPVWKEIIDRMENNTEKSNIQVLELVNYQYGYIAWCIGNGKRNEAQNYLKQAEKNLLKLENQNYEPSKVSGYRSAFYGFHIGLNVFLAPFIGPKSFAAAKKALTDDPEDYFGYIQMGNVLFNAPGLVGGSRPEALKNFLKAKVLMERNSSETSKNWNYLSLLTTIAQAFESLDDKLNAKIMYEYILKFEPDYTWVKDELYPQLKKKLN